MSSLLSAELAATCSALGYYDAGTKKYYADKDTLETVKDLIRYLRRDDENHDIRRQLGNAKVLQTDLLPMLKCYWEETELFDVLLRLLVNLTTPAVTLWNDQVPTDKITRNYYIQVVDHLRNYKEAFADQDIWSVLSRRLSKILESEYSERGDENSLIIERILILLRNVLYVPIEPYLERPDDDASIHDQVLWSLHQSGMLDIILYMASSQAEQAYYIHIIEILYFMLREQKPSELAKAALQRSETEKMRDEAELLAMRHREAYKKQQNMKKYTGARHSRFGGTYVVKSMKSISENDLVYHKPLNKIDELNFDMDKKKPKTPKNRLPVFDTSLERRSAFSIRLFLKEFCIEFLNGAYNTFMNYVKHALARGHTQDNDEFYYFWSLRFFMEINRCYKFDIKLVSETMSMQTFHYIQREMEKYFDMMQSDKKTNKTTSRRLHMAVLAYRELFYTICTMDKSQDETVRSAAKVIKSNIFYVPEYRELLITLLITYDELKSSDVYLNDLIETQHIFFKLLEKFCSNTGGVMVKKKTKAKKKKTAAKNKNQSEKEDLESHWTRIAPQLTVILEDARDLTSDVPPFDAGSDIPIDDQKSIAMKNIQRKLRNEDFENALGLLHAAREVWPENDDFGNVNMSKEEEFLALKDIFLASIDEEETAPPNDQDEQDDNEEEYEEYEEMGDEKEYKIEDFIKRLANPKIVRACGLSLKNFEKNNINTNLSTIKLLHRIAFDCKMYVMLFQVSLFRTFQQIFKVKELPQHKELVKFAIYIMRQFFKVAETNKKVYIEALFWKNSREAYDIEQGYGSYQEKSHIRNVWTEENEDELRRLFMEHREKQIEEDVVDWIVDNLIDNTKTRRGVLKKLKEMMLITDKPKSTAKASRIWTEDEEGRLTELFNQFKEEMDPMACIMERMGVKRAKNNVIDKLISLGLIQDRKEIWKKRSKSSKNKNKNGDELDRVYSDVDARSDSGSNSEDENRSQHLQNHRINTQNRRLNTLTKKSDKPKNSTRRKKQKTSSKREIIALLLALNSQFDEALEWLKESFSDALEDMMDTGNDENSLPLVPIMDYAVDAIENVQFQTLLKAMGIAEPCQGQEIYWRIPENMSTDTINEYIQLLTDAINKSLEIPQNVNESNANITENDETRNDIKIINDTVEKVFNKNASRLRFILNDSEDEEDEKSSNSVNENEPKLTENDSSNDIPENSHESISDNITSHKNTFNKKPSLSRLIDSESEDEADDFERKGGHTENNEKQNTASQNDNEKELDNESVVRMKRTRKIIDSGSESEQDTVHNLQENDNNFQDDEETIVAPNKKRLSKRIKLIDSDDDS